MPKHQRLGLRPDLQYALSLQRARGNALLIGRKTCRPGKPAVVSSADLVAKAAAIAQAAVATVRAHPGR